MVVEGASGKLIVNKYIHDLARQERAHAVATTIIRADKTVACKAIFNSQLEYTIYNALTMLFPNHLVFPNMSLQTVFQYERMKDLLDGDIFGYFLRSQVDFCITSTATYFPMVAFEVDSHYHDQAKMIEKDERKNTIFKTGGVPLLRLRPHGQPSVATIREEIVRVVRQLGQDISRNDRTIGDSVKLTMEIDFEHFGTDT